eukprot:XP_001689858.1 predicted protein [Chlamydomonas reinhardtii]
MASSVPLVIGWGSSVTSGSYHGASLWFTTLCALSVALGALSYNLMATLSEFFNFDRRTLTAQPRTYLYGVDVTGSRFFRIPAVLAAVEFAAVAHAAQRRKTGEPYVTHCIETALIVEACLPTAISSTEHDRHVACIMAAVLHDVIDDTPTDPAAMAAAFGPRVAGLVAQVSKLSQMNQLLRRGKRQEAVEACYRLVSAVHSIWKPIKREFDDYIANPKPSGYQALHTAVRGPGGIPMEVQIKTSSMHELAEYGAAAHWVYKEYTPLLQHRLQLTPQLLAWYGLVWAGVAAAAAAGPPSGAVSDTESGAGVPPGKYAAQQEDYGRDEVSVLIWPGGNIEYVARGTTAGDIAAEKGLGEMAGRGYPAGEVLNDGDLVILSREKVVI